MLDQLRVRSRPFHDFVTAGHGVLHDGNKLDIVASISQGHRSLAIVTRNDRGIKTLQDLRGKSVGLSMGTNLTYCLDVILQTRGVPSSEINFIDLNTADTLTAFKAGRIDAAVVYQPYLSQLETELGNRIKVFYGDDVSAFRWLASRRISNDILRQSNVS